MLNMMIAVYRAWPFRPHCSESRHVALCRLLGMSVKCHHEHPYR